MSAIKCEYCGNLKKSKDADCSCEDSPKKEIKEVDLNKNNLEATKGVHIKNITMSFESMVIFMVKWVFASIPAIIIITLIIWPIWSFFAKFLLPIISSL